MLGERTLFQRILSEAFRDPAYAGLVYPCLWSGRWGGETTCREWWLSGYVRLDFFSTEGAYMCIPCRNTFAAFRAALSRDPSDRGAP